MMNVLVLGLVLASEPEPRLSLGAAGGYGFRLGNRYAPSESETSGSAIQLGVDGRYRVVGPLSVGLFARFAVEEAQDEFQFSRFNSYRFGALASVTWSISLVTFGFGIGLGIRLKPGDPTPFGSVDVSVMFRVTRVFSIGSFIEGAVTQETVRGHPIRTISPTGVAEAIRAVPYGWLTVGLRGTVNLL